MQKNFTRTMSFEQRLGYIGEKWVHAELTRRGYTAHLVSDFFADCDILIRSDLVLPVEVKTSTGRWQSNGQGSYRRRWQFDCARLPAVDSVVILIAIAEGERYYYCIPSWTIKARGTRNPTLTSHPLKYSGWLSPYLGDWQQIDRVMFLRRRFPHPAQMSFNLADLEMR